MNNFAEVNIELADELKAALNKSSLSAEEKKDLLSYVESFLQNQEKINEHDLSI